MEFKVIGSVSNVRPSKSENPELSTTPTNGNIKVNSPGAEKLGVTVGDFVAIVKAEDETGVALYATKGHAGSGKGVSPVVRQVGSILSGKSGGSLLFSSENAYRELEGNKEDKKVYEIGDAIESDGSSYYKLTLIRTEPKAVREKATATH